MRCSLLIFAAAGLIVASASAVEPIASGLNEIVVYEPGVHERGLPAALLEDMNGRLSIDIPPTVHVHRYYYSGDKEVQGPIVNGGPTIVVANHPHTGQRMYIDAVLPAGTPKIAYNKHGITYVFVNQRVSIRFHRFPRDPEKASVRYQSGYGIQRKVGEASQRFAATTKTHFKQSQLTQSLKETARKTGNLALGVTEAAGSLGSQIVDGASSLIDIIPGVAPLTSDAQSRGESHRAAEIQAADHRKRHRETAFVPTLR